MNFKKLKVKPRKIKFKSGQILRILLKKSKLKTWTTEKTIKKRLEKCLQISYLALMKKN